MATSLEKTEEIVLRWGFSNMATYDIAKIKVILFSKIYGKKGKEKVANTKLIFKEQEGKFNDKATSLLEIWLEKGLIFVTYIRKRVKKAQVV